MIESEVVEQPVFIVGPLRSGTTLLRLMLENHPDMNFFGEFEGAVSQAIGQSFPNIIAYRQFVATDRMMQDANFNVDNNLEYIELVKSFLLQAYQKKPVNVIGACIHSRFDLLPKIWPNAKFIHITRDPRDVAKSTIPMGWAGNVYGGAKYWLEPAQRWEVLKEKLKPASYIEVKYEDLIRATDKELRKLCEFLGQRYNENMPDIDKISTYSRPDPKLVEQWRKKQSPNEILSVESQCRELMVSLGYKVINLNPDNDPSTLQRFILKFDNKIKRTQFSINRYGIPLWLYKVISNRLPLFKSNRLINNINRVERLYLK